MRTRLAQILSTVVLTGAGGAAVACGSAGGSDCPHQVIDRQAYVNMSQGDACQALAGATYNYYTDGFGALSPTLCKTLCNDSSITNCFLPYEFASLSRVDDAGTRSCPLPDGSTAVTLTCQVSHSEGTFTNNCPVAGRRTQGLPVSTRERHGAEVGAYFAQCAELEAISVHAFQRLAAELRSFAAPRALVARAARAAEEEIVHTGSMSWLAQRFGATAPKVTTAPLPLRPLFEVALENAVEGAVRETFGAAVALHQSAHAADPVVRAIHARIAEEERTHAELALDLERWFDERLGAEERAAIATAKRAAIAELRVACTEEASTDRVTFAGLPRRDAALHMVDGLVELLWDHVGGRGTEAA